MERLASASIAEITSGGRCHVGAFPQRCQFHEGIAAILIKTAGALDPDTLNELFDAMPGALCLSERPPSAERMATIEQIQQQALPPRRCHSNLVAGRRRKQHFQGSGHDNK